MRFLYKIWSNYDGFYPRRIPDRLTNGGRSLVLGWQRYLDVVDIGDDVWVYFHGNHRFDNGVYVKGRVEGIDPTNRQVLLRVHEQSASTPLTDTGLSARIAQVVAPKYRQVFLLPEELEAAPACTITSDLSSCAQHLCDACKTWQSWHLIGTGDLRRPARIRSVVTDYVPAYWSVPNRSYLFHNGGTINRRVRMLREQFTRFKIGEDRLAYPFALGMHAALARSGYFDFDAIVPIPLSPDKEATGEYNRTLGLAEQLAAFTGVNVNQALGLSKPISKKQRRTRDGLTAAEYEYEYRQALTVEDDAFDDASRVLLVDDACTEGSTFRCATQAIRGEAGFAVEVIAVSAVQMAVKAVVADETDLR